MRCWQPWDESNVWALDWDFDDGDLEPPEDGDLTTGEVIALAASWGLSLSKWKVQNAIRQGRLNGRMGMVGGHRTWLIRQRDAELWLEKMEEHEQADTVKS